MRELRFQIAELDQESRTAIVTALGRPTLERLEVAFYGVDGAYTRSATGWTLELHPDYREKPGASQLAELLR